MLVPETRHPGFTPRRAGGLTCYERALARAGLTPVAGIDEAGRGACAGPLVVAAVCLDPAKLPGLTGVADSKALSAAAREQAYSEVMRAALGWHAVIIPPQEIDRLGLHVCNVSGMRRALAGLACRPAYVLTDGFPVRGLGVPALAMWKGDEVAACVAAASVVAKVTRDRLMRELDTRFPAYGFAEHKGYSTAAHMKALAEHGPCPQHRRSFVNVRALGRGPGGQRLETGTPVGLDEILVGAEGRLVPDDVAGADGLLDRAQLEEAADGLVNAFSGDGAVDEASVEEAADGLVNADSGDGAVDEASVEEAADALVDRARAHGPVGRAPDPAGEDTRFGGPDRAVVSAGAPSCDGRYQDAGQEN
jgi:ribonuclease HII